MSRAAGPALARVPACLAAFALIGASQALYGPALGGIATRFDLDVATASLVVSAHWSGALLGAVLLLSERIDRTLPARPSLACLAVAIGAGGVALADRFGVLLASAAAIGLGYGWLSVGLNDLFGRAARGPVMVNLLNAGFGGGAILAPLLLVGSGLDARAAFGAMAPVSFAVAIGLLGIDDRRSRDLVPSSVRQSSRLRGAEVAVLAGVAATVAFEASLATWGIAALEGGGMTTARATLVLSGYFAVFLGARLVAVAASAFVAARTVLLATLAVAIAGCVATGLGPSPAAGFALAGVVGASFPAAFLWSSDTLAARLRTAPLVIVAALCGGVGGPVLVGYAARLMGEGRLPALLALVGALACAAILLAGSNHAGAERALTP